MPEIQEHLKCWEFLSENTANEDVFSAKLETMEIDPYDDLQWDFLQITENSCTYKTNRVFTESEATLRIGHVQNIQYVPTCLTKQSYELLFHFFSSMNFIDIREGEDIGHIIRLSITALARYRADKVSLNKRPSL